MVWLKQIFKDDKIPKANMQYKCIALITIDSVMRMEKKNYPQAYLEECKRKTKETKMTNFMKVGLESKSGSESDTELELKFGLKSDTE